MHKIGLMPLIAMCVILGITIGLGKAGLCETRTDKILQNDILSNMIVIDRNSGKPVKPQIVSQKVLKVTNDESTGQWKEIWEEWQVKWGAEERTFIIKLVPAAEGGVDFSIIPKRIAEKQGLLIELTNHGQ